MTDLTLFDLTHSRPTDPDTSKDAAVSVLPAAKRQCAEVLDAVCRLDPQGATAYEVLTFLERDGRRRQQSVVARRLSDLRDVGLIVDSGERRRGMTGRDLIVWKVVPR